MYFSSFFLYFHLFFFYQYLIFFIIFSNGDGRGKEWLAKNLLMEQKKSGENADIGKYWLNFYADNSTDFSAITG